MMDVLNIGNCSRKHTQGVALIAALILMAVLSVMGATVLTATSTEITISGNYRRGVERFYHAEAGIAEGRARLRGDVRSNPQLIEDSTKAYDPRWTAYILTSANWSSSHDSTFYKGHTNYFPVVGNQHNSIVLQNSLQRSLSYWVKVKHKTEYDAERDGHRSDAPHYVDSDGSLKTHTRANAGHVILYGYPTANTVRPLEFTSHAPIEGSYPVERIVSSAGGIGGAATIEVDVVHPPIPHVLAAIYAKEGASFVGPLNVLSGNDQCRIASSKPPIYTSSAKPATGPASFSGVPPSPQQGVLEISLLHVIDSLKSGANLVTTHQSGVNWGNMSSSQTVLVDASSMPGGISIRHMQGVGILLIVGDVILEGPVHWQGLLLGTGTIRVNGATGSIRIEGAVWTNKLVDLGGSFSVAYDSCAIKTAVLSQPLIVKKWKQLL
ncbi:PilX N-terminal domain-containing pilus assembly protein [Nitrospira sp. M1]